MTHSDEELRTLVREVAGSAFGFGDLRPGQLEAAAAVLSGRDVLAVMPTGAGKSAVYQLAGALLDGTTVVVSPLIALQQDQVEAIGGRLGGAALVNSAIGRARRRETFDDLERGELEFVFVAPEQLANDETYEKLRSAGPTLFVVDEAHCISTWGHDFRPDYLRLGAAIESLGRPQVLALTATAAPPVRAEIVERLGMRNPAVVVSGFDRPNISLEVVTARDADEARKALVERARGLAGTGIVYVGTRRDAEDLAAELDGPDRPAAAYHAGMAADAREAVHERFLRPEPFVVVATIAFGMGIDAPHVRFVLHAEPPESLDAYYQELGRAGRDGAPAEAVVFRSLEGGGRRRFMAGAAALPPPLLEGLLAAATAAAEPVPIDTLAQVVAEPPARVARAVDALVEQGALAVSDGTVTSTGSVPSAEAVAEASARHEAYRAVERSRRQMMSRYLDAGGCRWGLVLGYLGQPNGHSCGRCDNCATAAATHHRDDERKGEGPPFALDTRVVHEAWGEGQVVGHDADTVTVLFDEGGYRTLAVELVAAKGLLRPA